MHLDVIFDNPIFTRELRRRMRGRGLIITLILYIALLCTLAFLVVWWRSDDIQSNANAISRGYSPISAIGQTLFGVILFIQSGLVLMVAPSITAAMVRTEKEKETFDFLRATAITSWSYVIGALLSTVLYVALALMCALPVLTIAYLYGGVSDIVPTAVILLSFSLVLSSAGLLTSCVTDKLRGGQANILTSLVVVIAFMMFSGFAIRIGFSGQVFGVVRVFGVALPSWAVALIIGVVISAVLLLISTRKIFNPAERALNYRQFAVIYLLLLLLAAAGGVGGFGAGTLGSTAAKVWMGYALLVFIAGGVAMQNTFIVSRVAVGNDRWRIKRRIPQFRGYDESILVTFLLSAMGAGVCAACLSSGALARGWYLPLLPPAVFLAFHAAVAKILINRMENEITILKVLVGFSAVVLGLPILAESFRDALRADLVIDFVASLSPLYAMFTFLDKGSANEMGVLATGVLAAAAALAWLVALSTKPRHDLADPHYELPL
ncbi:MAG: ABC transporter permease [Candidatus Sumerlaeaceae bacterium]|nr:ABC transporter permease [Candidatus Sumerlaeaceae bacterium]